MKCRSWLIVPGDSAAQLGSAFAAGADVVVVDLEETVPHERKPQARLSGAGWLAAHRTNLFGNRRMSRWVRINALDSGHSREDLAAVMPSAPDGIILPKAESPEAVRQLASELYELEQGHAIPANSTQIIPVVGETPLSAMRIAEHLEVAHQRLCGLTWSARALCASIGGTSVRGQDGSWGDVCGFVRAQTVLTAHASQVVAIDAPFDDPDDAAGLAASATRARADGFAGIFAVNAAQVAAINAAFAPSATEVQEANEIVAAFATNPHASALPLRGRPVDRSQLARARRVIELADNDGASGAAWHKPILRPA